VRERLRVYEAQTSPLVAHYRGSATFHAIDGNRPPTEVAASLREAVAGAGMHASRRS
jgi:adenylate kinase